MRARPLAELMGAFFRVELVQMTGHFLREGVDPAAAGPDDYVVEIRPRETHRRVEGLAEAHLIRFLCPLCFEQNGGAAGTHMVIVPFANRGCPTVPMRNRAGDPVWWQVAGTGLHDLVLTPSVQLLGGCNWHGFVGSSGIAPGHAG